jgi:hypothetical protein
MKQCEKKGLKTKKVTLLIINIVTKLFKKVFFK